MHGKNFNQSEAKSAKRRVSRRRTTRHVTPGPLGGISLASFSRFISCVQLSPGLCVLLCPVCRGFPSGRYSRHGVLAVQGPRFLGHSIQQRSLLCLPLRSGHCYTMPTPIPLPILSAQCWSPRHASEHLHAIARST